MSEECTPYAPGAIPFVARVVIDQLRLDDRE